MEDLDKCWCGSGKAYKDCHLAFDQILEAKKKEGYNIPPHRFIKNEAQIEGIKKASVFNNGLLNLMEEKIKAGMSTEELDDLAVQYLKEHDCKSADFHFEGYPKSICTSVNSVVCHGIPSPKVILKDGDIVNVDTTLSYNGFFADASRMFEIGKVSDEAHRLVQVTRECMLKGIEAVVPFESTVNDIGKAIEKYAHLNGYSVVEEYCGHGVGLAMHEDPIIPHFSEKYDDTYLLVPGMVFTIEPMINEGKRYITTDMRDGWTVRTKDGKLSAQWENTLVVKENGIEILSK